MNISDKQFYEWSQYEKKIYLRQGKKKALLQRIEQPERFLIWKAIYWLRKLESLQQSRRTGAFRTISALYITRRLNDWSAKAGIEIRSGYTSKGLNIWHGGVVINGYVGENCVFHGNNIIGNKVSGSKDVPRLGNNVEVGANAVVIGNVTIADHCIIGAGAVVTKSFLEPGTIIAGVPAREIGRK